MDEKEKMKLEKLEQKIRHQICQKIRENSHPYGFGYIVDTGVLKQIEKGEKNEK